MKYFIMMIVQDKHKRYSIAIIVDPVKVTKKSLSCGPYFDTVSKGPNGIGKEAVTILK